MQCNAMMQDTNIIENCQDFYEVFWEGFARVMPSTAALAGRHWEDGGDSLSELHYLI